MLACRLLTARFFFQDPVNIPADLLNFLYFIFQREISIGYAVSSKRWVLRLPRFSDTRQSDFGFALHKKAENEAHNGGAVCRFDCSGFDAWHLVSVVRIFGCQQVGCFFEVFGVYQVDDARLVFC